MGLQLGELRLADILSEVCALQSLVGGRFLQEADPKAIED